MFKILLGQFSKLIEKSIFLRSKQTVGMDLSDDIVTLQSEVVRLREQVRASESTPKISLNVTEYEERGGGMWGGFVPVYSKQYDSKEQALNDLPSMFGYFCTFELRMLELDDEKVWSSSGRYVSYSDWFKKTPQYARLIADCNLPGWMKERN